MAEQKEYLSPTDNNPLQVVTNAAGETVYREKSTGHEYSEEYVKANFKTRDEMFPPAKEEKKAKSNKKQDGPSGPAGDDGASGASGAQA